MSMPNWWQKTLAATAGAVGLASGVYYVLMRRPLPRKNGAEKLQGLHSSVEVLTDCYGVPHIYAENEADLFFAQGYVHAKERFWQMELNRRIGSGRLAEIFGELAVETDRFSRRLGMHRAAADEAERLPEAMRRMLEAYASGVNAYIKRYANRLPLEFTLLRFSPSPWRIEDSIVWAKMMGWNLSGNWETEIIRARIVATLGIEQAAKLEAGYDPDHPLILPPGVEYGGVNLGLLEQYEQLKQLSGFGLLGASNNWVVSGAMTRTGKPILCNDPHLGQAAPSIWFECHLVAGELDVIGASFPGAPGVVIGHNQHIAWGMTNAVSDVQDMYIEKFNPANPSQYEYQGHWEEAQVIREEIKVKGSRAPVIEKVRVTRHGPIIADLRQDANNGHSGLPLALRWSGLEQCNILSAVSKLDRASNWQEFREALRDWDVPPQNVIYADKEGNIGYVMAGAIPVRARGQALLPSPGWTGEYEWTGYIPFDELPQVFNPEQGFIVTANNRVVDDDYPYYITQEWLNGYRAQRIRDLLLHKSKAGKLGLSDMASIQADQYALPAVEIVPFILEQKARTALEKTALELLRSWNFMLVPDSIGASIYTTFLNKLQFLLLQAKLGEDETLIHSYLGRGSSILAPVNGYASRSKPLIIRLLKAGDDSWFADSVVANGPRSWKDALASAFSATIEDLRERLGEDMSRWQYGKIHTMTYNHPLGMIKPLDRIFNRGPFPVGGDIDTVCMGASQPGAPETVITVPSYRQIVNLADMNSSLSGHAPGQSGHPGSKHYDDFIQMWLHVSHHPMLVERVAIEMSAEGILNLRPAD